MAKLTRGFTGRRQAARDGRLPPGQYDVGRQWPVLTAEVTPTLVHRHVVLHHRRSGRKDDHVDVGGDASASAVYLFGRHPLRDDMVEARASPSPACRSTPCWRRQGRWRAPPTSWPTPTPVTPPTCPWPTSPAARRGWSGKWTVSPSPPSTAARPGCWFPTSISGRAPNGSRVCELLDHDEPGFWEQNGYHDRGDPWLEQRYQGTEHDRPRRLRRGRHHRVDGVTTPGDGRHGWPEAGPWHGHDRGRKAETTRPRASAWRWLRPPATSPASTTWSA